MRSDIRAKAVFRISPWAGRVGKDSAYDTSRRPVGTVPVAGGWRGNEIGANGGDGGERVLEIRRVVVAERQQLLVHVEDRREEGKQSREWSGRYAQMVVVERNESEEIEI